MKNTTCVKSILFVCFILLASSRFSYSQERVGRVLDKKSKKPIPGVYISVNNKPITATDENGLFALGNIHETDTINFSHLMCENKDILSSTLKGDTALIKLQSSCFDLNEVSVVESKVKHIIKKAHKAFVKQYQPINCWTKAKYKHLLLADGNPLNFLESHGYAMLRKPRNGAFESGPLFIEVNTRRTQMHGENMFSHKRKATKSIPFDVFMHNCRIFAFCQRIMPLGKFNFRDYRFKLDSLSDSNDNQYVINFVQRSKRMLVSGWKLWGASGRIWINRKSFLPEKMTFVYKFMNDVREYEISFLHKNNMIFPEQIKLVTTHRFFRKLKQPNNYISISQLNFFDIDTIARINYRLKKMETMEYCGELLSPDIKYNHEYWRDYRLKQSKWYSEIKTLCHANLKDEFKKGDIEPILNKNNKYYKSYIEGSELKRMSKNFVNQMKKDLKIEGELWGK